MTEAYLGGPIERTWTFRPPNGVQATLGELQSLFPAWRTTRIQKDRYLLSPTGAGAPRLVVERWSERDSGPVVYACSDQVYAVPVTRWMARHVLGRFGLLPNPDTLKIALR